jgi:hypothetical protein
VLTLPFNFGLCETANVTAAVGVIAQQEQIVASRLCSVSACSRLARRNFRIDTRRIKAKSARAIAGRRQLRLAAGAARGPNECRIAAPERGDLGTFLAVVDPGFRSPR